MTDQELKDLVASLSIAQKETNEQMQRTNKQMKKTDEKANKRLEKLEKFINKETKDTKKLKEMIFGIGKSQGLVAEEFFENSLRNNQKIGGVVYDEMISNMKKIKGKLEAEYDLILVNGKELAIIEVKYNAHLNDLDKFLNIQYPKFKQLYPEYSNYKHNLVFASFHIHDDFKQEALNNNVIVLQRKGNIIESFLP
jgi:hypothetical protein